MKSLPALISEANDVARFLMESDGEITPEVEALIDKSGIELSQKMDSYFFVIQELQSRATAAQERADEWAKAAKACSSAVQNLKTRVMLAMQSLDVPEMSGSEVTFRRQANPPATIIENQALIPDEFINIEVPPPVKKIDKKAIADAIKRGREVPGARLDRGERLVTKVAASNKLGDRK
ncbi:putative Phage protein [Azospirillaceae bacterium]